MIGLDTNVVIRFLVGDDKTQSSVAKQVFEDLTEQDPGYICREVIIEVVWVLERAYKLSRKEIVVVIEGLITSKELVVEDATRVGVALSRYLKGGAGFSDRMILMASEHAECIGLVTFDKSLAKDNGCILL